MGGSPPGMLGHIFNSFLFGLQQIKDMGNSGPNLINAASKACASGSWAIELQKIFISVPLFITTLAACGDLPNGKIILHSNQI
jgi:hypothetical protein